MDISIKANNLKLVQTGVVIMKKNKDTTKLDITLNNLSLEIRLYDEEREKSPAIEVFDNGKKGIFTVSGITSDGVGVWDPIFIATVNEKKIFLSYLVNKIGTKEENLGYRFEYSLYSED